jgi:hypothetical protein
VGGVYTKCGGGGLESAGLKIEWGAFAASAAAAPLPALAPGELCNDSTVLCYDHQQRDGF